MQSDAIRCNRRQSEAISCTHLLSESIGGNQIASETMREAIGGNRRHNGQRADPRCAMAITNDESQSGIAIIRQSVQLQRSEFRIQSEAILWGLDSALRARQPGLKYYII